ncbi:MAG: agmatine/peptidylarginine deiminase [Lachnospiraceae bacterium]
MNKSYFMPAEWEEHELTWISWPVKESLVHPENYTQVCEGYAEVICAISEFEQVCVLSNQGDQEQIRSMCNERILIAETPHNDAWIRDNGPTILMDQNGSRCGIDWRFNAWGEKYTPYDLDDAVAKRVLAQQSIPRMEVELVMEGGSIHSDGEGTILTTEQCLLHQNRNPERSKSEIEELLKDYLGARKIIWLKQGLFGDETDGHVDNIACFISPGKVMIQICTDESDENFDITHANLAILHHETDGCGRTLDVIRIPQPPARYENGQRLTLSYLNFYIANGGIVLPIFGGDAKETDMQAVGQLQSVFPDYKIVTVDGMKLIREGGNVHCITQQLPRQKGGDIA